MEILKVKRPERGRTWLGLAKFMAKQKGISIEEAKKLLQNSMERCGGKF